MEFYFWNPLLYTLNNQSQHFSNWQLGLGFHTDFTVRFGFTSYSIPIHLPMNSINNVFFSYNAHFVDAYIMIRSLLML